MTSLTQNTGAVSGASLWERLSDLAAGFGQRRAQQRAQHRAYRSTVRELTAMSHHELTDIGIHPADIHTIARQATCAA